MGLTLLTERHEKEIAGVWSCFDGVILPIFSCAEGMSRYLTVAARRPIPSHARPQVVQRRAQALWGTRR